MYRAGCRCVPCKAASALARAALRKLHATQKQPLGARIGPSEARKRIAQLKAERVSGRAVNRLSGLKSHALVVHSAITVRKLLRIRRIYRFYMTGEGPDQPLHASE